jgi:hypothetical protein
LYEPEKTRNFTLGNLRKFRYELYPEKKPAERDAIITLYANEVGDALRHRGFTISDNLFWQRLYEFNKTIKKSTFDQKGGETVVYWLCEPHIAKARDSDKGEKEIPFMFRMGVVANEIARLARTRQLEEEQLRFWTLYKWAAIATVGLAIVTSACAVINCWLTYQRH